MIAITGKPGTGKTLYASYLANKHGLSVNDSDPFQSDVSRISEDIWITHVKGYAERAMVKQIHYCDLRDTPSFLHFGSRRVLHVSIYNYNESLGQYVLTGRRRIELVDLVRDHGSGVLVA